MPHNTIPPKPRMLRAALVAFGDMSNWDRIRFGIYALAGLMNLIAFFADYDVDKLVIAVLFAGAALWDWNATKAGQLIDSYADMVDELLDENYKLLGEVAKWSPLSRHEARFADMPRIGGRRMDVPQGHPEYRGGDK